MAARLPIVIANGKLQQLQPGDSIASGPAQGLSTATTVVDVSLAAAPSSGQVLMATSATLATWQTPSGGGGGGDVDGGNASSVYTATQYINGGSA
jgi:hypothetical protein